MNLRQFKKKLSQDIQILNGLAEKGITLAHKRIVVIIGDIKVDLNWLSLTCLQGEIRWANRAYERGKVSVIEGRLITKKKDRQEAVKKFMERWGSYILKGLQWRPRVRSFKDAEPDVFRHLVVIAVSEIAKTVEKPVKEYTLIPSISRKF